MSVESRFVWMDGKLVPFQDAHIHVLSHTLHYGLGVFEGIRAYRQSGGGGGIWKLDAHLRRLYDSAKMCRMTIPFGYEAVRQGVLDTLRANELDQAYIRPVAFFGMGEMGLGARSNPVHVVIAVWKWGAYMGEDGLAKGIRCGTSSFTRHHINASLQRAKIIGHYVNSILARYEAQDAGYDEAIMLDGQGRVAEGTGENIFVARDGVVKTPPVINILAGITRKTAIDILKREGLEVREELFGRDAMYVADEVFLTGTAAEVTPVREIDHRPVGEPGPITRKVMQVYGDGVRGDVDWMRESIVTY